jgi:hypothetical protein
MLSQDSWTRRIRSFSNIYYRCSDLFAILNDSFQRMVYLSSRGDRFRQECVSKTKINLGTRQYFQMDRNRTRYHIKDALESSS